MDLTCLNSTQDLKLFRELTISVKSTKELELCPENKDFIF